MKVLATGLDETTIAFLQGNGIAIEKQDIEDAEDLETWLEYDLYDAGVINLEKSGLGIYAARGLRLKKIPTPLIGISRGSEDWVWSDYRAMFLENGGDDLLRGPVNPRELVASLRGATRRFKGGLLDIVEYQNGDAKLKINLTTHSILVNDSPIYPTSKELTMLLLFASSVGRVLSKEMLLLQMYTQGVEDEPEMKIVDVFVCKLRKKLTDAHPDAGKFIETVWGRGYRLVEKSETTTKSSEAA